MWLGEQITERGSRERISLIIFAGIVARMPLAISNSIRLLRTGELGILVTIGIIVLMVGVVGRHHLCGTRAAAHSGPIREAHRGPAGMYGGQSTHLPLKINTAGVIPPIFASSIIMFPATIANFIDHPWMKAASDSLMPGRLSMS